MLRRTRLSLPVMVAIAAVAGALFHERLALVVVLVIAGAALLDAAFVRVEEARLRNVADKVVSFASDEQRQPLIPVEGGREWQRMVTALNEVARVLRERFEALRGERQRVGRLLDAIPTAVLLFTAEGLAYANPQAHEQFELGETATGLTPLRALGSRELQQAVEEAAETGRSLTIEVRRGDRELAATATRIAPSEVALIVTDLTQTKRVEAMRRDFVANASHELKTPVTGMQALSDSLQLALERDPERARSMVERIRHEATRLARLVRDLLDLTRLEEGADDRTRQRVDIAELCEGQVTRLATVAEQRQVELRVLKEGEVSVIGIADDLKIAVGNLLQNAILYNREGGVVTVRVARDGANAVIEVADSGIGIPEAEQDRIFERFYRVDKARSRAAGGTGLGLSLVRNAVERHGGTVRVASVLGEGSTFTVELPVHGGVV